MARYKRFTFLCNKDERRLIEVLAQRLERNQSDAIRFVIKVAVQELGVINRCNSSTMASLEEQNVK